MPYAPLVVEDVPPAGASSRSWPLTDDRCSSNNETMVASPSRCVWVLLSYRIPREPSTPRIAVWRRLKRLGVAQIGDGLVALPADARTQEQLEWLAEEIAEAN